ncbi:GTP diphosphokinase / guanosine-3',5'-bis(diphosphate) 3'-diphosphatase [Fistulifera solaris]|uniref:Putative GTP diphosphokinase RSH1, chloroplastic n=1 Tax=Fistulifera solaris TaxID=1519565 RepID=A0A1Z5K5T6_FISSO|nr:GTP diphosphokinase / guanosine-3',5'-bis(diphosphate) 3'-diphosphatase [Fistulifera solaris]|eukprot:GAX21653.1 GTP diphosphokinase / guanosine-3',5'-bis(diphosphate) 3'-diphosphatase [Fistulifera solaris]
MQTIYMPAESSSRRKRRRTQLPFAVCVLLCFPNCCEAFLPLARRRQSVSSLMSAIPASPFPNYTSSSDQRNDTIVSLNWGTPFIHNNENIQKNTTSWSSFETLDRPDPLTDDDLQQIEQYWDQIMPVVNYLGTEKVAKIYHALQVAYTAHRGQMRKSGEPFIIHPVQVAILLAGLKMDGETVIAGLLHDTVEDTEMTFDQIETLFGKTVRTIVEGETKVSKLPKMVAEYSSSSEDAMMSESPTHHDEQAENLRQMFVAMTEDYRIIIVKLADRLHNMRTLRHMKPLKQIKISRETLDIFAPLAHRMGIWQFKSELEDTAFMYLYPQEYKRLNRMLRQHQTKYRETLDKSQLVMQRRLDADSTLAHQAAKVEVQGRTKELYSLWHKMETKGVHNLDNIVDVVALRVVITPKSDADLGDENESDRGVWLCYHVLGLVQHLPGFQPVPTRVKDYISFPKPNGYQSLHTALILNGQTIEVQIRTSYMHQVAEYGMASHWAYTDEKRRSPSSRNPDGLYFTPWLSSIKEWQKDRISSRDFVDSVRRELLGKRVFVFLRNGKILNLARGATAIDAAFQIHTEVGLNMYRVEINGKPVPFSYELQNGDVVSILTGKGGKPSTDWMRYAKSRSTRSKLRAYFRARQRESLREAGHILLKDYLAMHGELIAKESYFEFDLNVPKKVEDVARFLPGKTRFETLDDLLVSIGSLHDRDKLHRIVSQLFEVPKRVLVDAEERRRLQVPSAIVSEALIKNRRRALDSANAASTTGTNTSTAFTSDPSWMHLQDENIGASLNHLLSGLGLKEELADPDQICEDCLPVYGDQIVGTCPEHSLNGDANDMVTTVHRFGCQHAQRAINKAQAELKGRKVENKAVKALPIDSVSLRKQNGNVLDRQLSRRAKRHSSIDDVPVKLKWSEAHDNDSFLSEIVVHCQDRRLLLADCSEVVSEMVEIMRTGSQTTAEHATLVFLVKVNGIHQLQQLMDRLNEVRSVMSVERRFGSELL